MNLAPLVLVENAEVTQPHPPNPPAPERHNAVWRFHRRRILGLLLIGMTLALIAHAYVDPGTGMMAVQALIALGIGVVAFVRHPIRTLKRWWARLRGRPDDDA